jgi:uncharacterized protein YciI
MYVVLLKYLKPIEEVERVTSSHRAYLDTLIQDGTLLLSGPQVPRTGGVLLVKSVDKERLKPILENDPFAIEGIAEYTVIEFTPSKKIPALNDLL